MRARVAYMRAGTYGRITVTPLEPGQATSSNNSRADRHISWLERLHQASAEQSERDFDPWRRVLERALPAAVSTVALCDLLR